MAFPLNSGAGENLNSNNPSPSLLREVTEVFKTLAVSEYTYVTPFRDMYSFDASLLSNPPTYNFPPPPNFNSKEAADSAAADSRSLDEKLEQLKLKALSFKQKLTSDRDRLLSLMQSNRPFLQQFKQELVEFMRVFVERGENLPNETIRNEIDSVIIRLNRANEDSVEVLQLEQVLTNSRLASLYEIMGSLSEMKKDLQKEVWDELNEDLMKAVDLEKKGYVLLTEETLLGLGYMGQKIFALLQMRSNWGGE